MHYNIENFKTLGGIVSLTIINPKTDDTMRMKRNVANKYIKIILE